MEQGIPLFPESASTISNEIDLLFFFLIAMSLFFVGLISSLILFFSVRYRRSRGRGATQIHGSTRLEVLWTLIPLVIALTCFGWGAKLYFHGSRPPAGALELRVTGKQWMWKIQHPTGQREINDLHVPVGVPIRLTMISEDVIHSFFVPAFRMKRDVLPGRYSTAWFEATRTGEYHLFCTEYCGTKHSTMIGRVYVMEQREYERWLEGVVAGETPREAGQKLFSALRCDTCHAETSGARGPSLAGVFGTTVELADGSTALFDAAYARESILEPRAKIVAGFEPLMPTYTGQLDEDQILSLIAYIESLTAEQGAGQ